MNHGVVPDCLPRKTNRKEVSKMSGKHAKSYHGQNKCVFVFLGIDQVLFQVVVGL